MDFGRFSTARYSDVLISINFSSTCGVLMNFTKSGINFYKIIFSAIVNQCLQNFFKNFGFNPITKFMANAVPIAVFFRQISPSSSAAENPQNCVKYRSGIQCGTTSDFWFRQKRFNKIPLNIWKRIPTVIECVQHNQLTFRWVLFKHILSWKVVYVFIFLKSALNQLYQHALTYLTI